MCTIEFVYLLQFCEFNFHPAVKLIVSKLSYKSLTKLNLKIIN